MFPIPWNFPFRKKNGDLSTISDVINSGGGGGSDLPPHDIGDAGKLLGVDSAGKLEWTDDVSSEIQTLTNEVDMLIDGGAVNKLPNTGTNDTKNGVTATYASDGKVTLNASSASTAISDFPISPTGNPFYLKEGTYVLSGGASADARLYIRTVASASAIAIDSGNGAEFTVTSEMASGGFAVYLNVASGKTFDNVVISPMIADAGYAGGYVPYAMTNRELTSLIPKVESVDVEISTSSGGATPYSYYGSYQIDINKRVIACWARQKSNDIPLPCTYNPSTGWFGIVANDSVTAILTYSYLNN